MAEWITRWGYEMKPTKYAGVMALRDGGWLVHGKKGRNTRLMKRLPEMPLLEAVKARAEMLLRAEAPSPSGSMPLFAEYARLLFDRKVARGKLKSKATRDHWESVLRLHLAPVFGPLPVDAITKLKIEAWQTDVAKKLIVPGKLKPGTANSWWTILRGIMRSAVIDYTLPIDPTLHVEDFSTDEHPTYTKEEPNSLKPEQVPMYLNTFKQRFPRGYAMALLGFVTGLRPSSLRPLRRTGSESDVLWDEGAIEIRRSHSRAQEIMNTTKTSRTYRIGLPPAVMQVLREHVARMTPKELKSELLFPSQTGRLEHQTYLTWRCHRVNEKLALAFNFTGRGLRRTYQDLARAGGVSTQVQQAICGHSSGDMTRLYSTFSSQEMATAIAQIAKVVLPRKRPTRAA